MNSTLKNEPLHSGTLSRKLLVISWYFFRKSWIHKTKCYHNSTATDCIIFWMKITGLNAPLIKRPFPAYISTDININPARGPNQQSFHLSCSFTAPTCGHFASPFATLLFLLTRDAKQLDSDLLVMWLKKKGTRHSCRAWAKITSYLWPVHWATAFKMEKRKRGGKTVPEHTQPQIKTMKPK